MNTPTSTLDETEIGSRMVREPTARVPGGRPFPTVAEPFVDDEARWFLAGLEAKLFRFQTCGEACPRRRRWGAAGPDEFLNPRGEPRHLFSSSHKPQPTLNREYVPHLAAHARAVLEFGHRPEKAALSEYRQFTRDLIRKRRGGSYEVDSLFAGPDWCSISPHRSQNGSVSSHVSRRLSTA